MGQGHDFRLSLVRAGKNGSLPLGFGPFLFLRGCVVDAGFLELFVLIAAVWIIFSP